MKLFLPNNLFSALFIALSKIDQKIVEINFKDTALVTTSINSLNNSIGLIPSLDILKNNQLFISQKYGISFNGNLSNAYIYFSKNSNQISKISFQGDVSNNEVILSKILFLEKFFLEPKFELDTSQSTDENITRIICGNKNWEAEIFNKGTSLSEYINELVSAPYVNYILASNSEASLKEFENLISITEMNNGITHQFLNKLNYNNQIKNYFEEEINSINYKLNDEDLFGLKEIINLCYFHQFIDDLIDIKFI